MSKGKLQHTVDRYRQELLAREKKAAQEIEVMYRHVLAAIQPQLDNLLKQLGLKQQAGEDIPPSWLYERNRLDALKRLVQTQIEHFGSFTFSLVEQMQRQSVSLGTQAASAMMEATVPEGAHWTFGMPSIKAITDLIGSLQNGSPLADLFKGFGLEAAKSVGEALVRGVTLGNNPRKVAKDVQEELNVSRNRALTISRQEMIRPYRSAALETYRANPDTIEQWEWSADKSGRTCAMCIAMDGTRHDVSEEFESHTCCRCSPIPVTKSWSDLLEGVDLSGLDEMESPQRQTGAEWFDQQSAEVQQQVLGPSKYAAYQDGAITLDDLVGTKQDANWGGSRYERSLKDVLGTKQAQQYYKKAS